MPIRLLSKSRLAGLLAASILATSSATAKNATEDKASVTGLPLPRFVSLEAGRVNMRIGPGTDYAVEWLYLKEGLPIEIIQEYDRWRRVRDSQGTQGWIYHSLLSGERTAIAAPWLKGKSQAAIDLHSDPSAESSVLARLEPGVVAKVHSCHYGWCEVEVSGLTGFLDQAEIWGVYPDENF